MELTEIPISVRCLLASELNKEIVDDIIVPYLTYDLHINATAIYTLYQYNKAKIGYDRVKLLVEEAGQKYIVSAIEKLLFPNREMFVMTKYRRYDTHITINIIFPAYTHEFEYISDKYKTDESKGFHESDDDNPNMYCEGYEDDDSRDIYCEDYEIDKKLIPAELSIKRLDCRIIDFSLEASEFPFSSTKETVLMRFINKIFYNSRNVKGNYYAQEMMDALFLINYIKKEILFDPQNMKVFEEMKSELFYYFGTPPNDKKVKKYKSQKLKSEAELVNAMKHFCKQLNFKFTRAKEVYRIKSYNFRIT